MKKSNLLFWITGLTMTVMGFLAKTVYRDFIYSNGIEDFGFAGFLPSYLYVIGFSQLLLILPSRHEILTISAVTAGSILFELMQYFNSGLFDLGDAAASIAGGMTSAVIVRIIYSRTATTNNSRGGRR